MLEQILLGDLPCDTQLQQCSLFSGVFSAASSSETILGDDRAEGEQLQARVRGLRQAVQACLCAGGI